MRRSFASGGGSATSRSMPHRKAASVLPEPVGARIRVCSPAAMAGQPWAWAAVGSGNVVANHSRTAGENRSSTIPSAYEGGVTELSGRPRLRASPSRDGPADGPR